MIEIPGQPVGRYSGGRWGGWGRGGRVNWVHPSSGQVWCMKPADEMCDRGFVFLMDDAVRHLIERERERMFLIWR